MPKIKMTKQNLHLKNSPDGNPLKPVCIIGLILALILSWGLVFFALFRGNDSSERSGASARESFVRELREYDLYNGPKRVLEGENPERIERRLSRLQRQVRGAEEQLSVLKRYRALALLDRGYINAYAKASKEAAKNFVHSSPIAAVAAEAIILDSASPFTAETISLLRSYSSGISQTRFDFLKLGLYILAGDLENPLQAAAIPDMEKLLSQDLSAVPVQVRNDLLINNFLLRAAKGDIPGASLRLNNLLDLDAATVSSNAGLLRMGAEFFYDHLNPMKAAELFSRLVSIGWSERDISGMADSLILAGDIPGARNVWLVLSSPERMNPGEKPGAAIVRRSLYNLAASSPDPEREAFWLERIFSQWKGGEDSTGIYSTIRYTRLLDTARSIAVLSDAVVSGEGIMYQNPLLDLENLRRRIETLPPTRTVSEVWLLLGRHSDDEDIYEWAAWFFDHQKLYDETVRLFKEADRKGMNGTWLDLHKSLGFLREGKITEGEKILLNIYSREANFLEASFRKTGLQGTYSRETDWRIPANLGRVQESRRAISSALEYYEAAAMAADPRFTEKTDSALLQMRLSRCLETLGRTGESRRAIETAFELDPDNINIRREYTRELR